MGNNFLNKAGEMHLHSVGDKLLESTGEDDSTLLGKLWTVLGKWLHWVCLYSVGEQSCTLLRNIKTARDVC